MMTFMKTSINKSGFTRRGACAAIGGGVAALVAAPVWALSTSTAESLVSKMIADINSDVLGGSSAAKSAAAFERIFKKYADINAIARYVLGAAGRGVSNSDLNAFSNAYIGYLSRKYSRRFGDFSGSDIKVTKAAPVKSFVKVDAVAQLASGSKVNVELLVSDKSGSTRVFNIFVEGVNMLLTERTEVGALLDARGGNIKKLTADLPKL